MPKDKQSFVIYKDWSDLLFNLSNEEMGILFKGIFDYQCFGNTPEFDGYNHLKGIFSFFKKAFQRDEEKYENICERNAKNGKKGGRPCLSNKPTGLLNNRTEPKKADNDNDNVNENDNGKDNDNDKTISNVSPKNITDGLKEKKIKENTKSETNKEKIENPFWYVKNKELAKTLNNLAKGQNK